VLTSIAPYRFIDSLVKRVERKIEDSAPEFQRHVVRQAAFRELQTTIQSATALCSTFTQPGAYRRLLRHKLDADKFSAVYERFSDTLFALGITEVEDASGWRAAQDLDHRHTEEVLKVIESDEADHTANAALATMQTAHHPKKRPRLIADGEEIGELRKDMMRRNKAQTDARAKGDDEGQGKDAWEIYYKEIVFSKDDDDDKIELGDGAFGKVYKGQFQGQGVAIKSVKILTPKLRSMARKEIAVMARLGHPHVVTFFGATVQKTKAHLVLQLCRCSLHRLIYHTDHEDFAGIHFDDVMRMRFAKETASGLEYLHDSRVVHRDIKPENVLLSWSDPPSACITDFGLAEMRRTTLASTVKVGQGGTLAYTAPEVLLEDGYGGKPVDVYSWSVTMNEMYAGTLPYEGLSEVQIKDSVLLSEAPENRPQIVETMPPLLRTVVRGGWIHSAKDRPTFHAIIVVLSTGTVPATAALEGDAAVIAPGAAGAAAEAAPARRLSDDVVREPEESEW